MLTLLNLSTALSPYQCMEAMVSQVHVDSIYENDNDISTLDNKIRVSSIAMKTRHSIVTPERVIGIFGHVHQYYVLQNNIIAAEYLCPGVYHKRPGSCISNEKRSESWKYTWLLDEDVGVPNKLTMDNANAMAGLNITFQKTAWHLRIKPSTIEAHTPCQNPQERQIGELRR
eukprot:15304511-Ditylum_brightwellii.AAC.1